MLWLHATFLIVTLCANEDTATIEEEDFYSHEYEGVDGYSYDYEQTDEYPYDYEQTDGYQYDYEQTDGYPYDYEPEEFSHMYPHKYSYKYDDEYSYDYERPEGYSYDNEPGDEASYIEEDSSTFIDYMAEENELDCPTLQDQFLPQKFIPWNVENRAYLTIPDGLRLANSSIPSAGQGIFSDIFIPSHTFLAEYEGEIRKLSHQVSPYTWMVFRGGEADYYIDGYDERTSNWLRWLNCARNMSELNVQNYSCKGKLLYATVRDITPGQELLVYYGDDYAEALGLNPDDFIPI